MSDSRIVWAVPFASLLALAMVTGALLYGCQISNEKYYALANTCIHEGGSWIPQGNSSWSGLCVHSGKTPP